MTVVETAYGKLRGTEIADGVLAWRGVPYAAPPVGELRLRPPAPPRAWAGIRDALEYGNRSLQPDEDGGPPLPLPPMAEDCLYLNVTAPAGRCRQNRRPPRAAVDSRRRVRDGARPRPGGRRRGVRAEPRTRRRDVQLPARCARVPRRPWREPDRGARPARPGRGAALDQGEHRGVRRRPGAGHRLRAVGGRQVGHQPAGLAAHEGPHPAGRRVERRRPRQEPGAGPRPRRTVLPHARHDVAADPGRPRGRHPGRAARRRRPDGRHLGLAAVRRRGRAHRRAADGHRGGLGGRGAAAAADLRPRDRPVPADGPARRRAGGPGPNGVLRRTAGGRRYWRTTPPPTPVKTPPNCAA